MQRHASSSTIVTLFAISLAVWGSCKESDGKSVENGLGTLQPEKEVVSEKDISIDKCTVQIANGSLYLGIEPQPIARLQNGLFRKDDLKEKNGLQIIELSNRLNSQCSKETTEKLQLVINEDIPYITLLQILWTGYLSLYSKSTKVHFGNVSIELAIAYQCVQKSEQTITFMLVDDDCHYRVNSSSFSIHGKESPFNGKLDNQTELDNFLVTVMNKFPEVKAAMLGGVDLTPIEKILNTGKKIQKIYSQSYPLCLTRGVQ